MKRNMIRVAVLTLVVLAVAGGTRWWQRDSESISVTAHFDNAAGLYVGNAVSVLGIPVGEVTAITPRPGSVEVAFRLDGDVPVPADAIAVTVSTSVLTDRHVELTPPYRSGPTLADGQVLGIDRTRTPVEVDRMLGMADTLATNLTGDGKGGGPVADLLGAGSAITSGNGADIRSALTALSRALALGPEQGARTRDDLHSVIGNVAELSDTAARNDATIRGFGSAIDQLARLLADQRIGWGTTGAQLNTIMAEMADLLGRRRGAIAHTVAGANGVTRALSDYRRSLEEFLDVTPLLMNNAYNVIDTKLGIARVHAQLDTVFGNGQLVKEICNVLGLRQLGCATGTLRDFGPDFGMGAMLTAMAGGTP